VHRRDLREVMLKQILQTQPDTARAISEKAVQWYSSDAGMRAAGSKRARAEEAYHRLLLGEDIGRGVVDDSDVFASLQASIHELPAASQRLLATYGFQVDSSILQRASQEERDTAIAEQIERLLPHRSALPQGDELLASPSFAGRDSPLWLAASRLHLESDRGKIAMQMAEQGLTFAVQAGDSAGALQLLKQKAWLCDRLHNVQEAEQTLPVLCEYVERHNDVAGRLLHWLLTARLERGAKAIEFPREFKGWLEQLSPRAFFGMFAAFGEVWKGVADGPAASPLNHVIDLVRADNSPFNTGTIEDPHAADAVSSLVRSTYGWGPGVFKSDLMMAGFAMQLVDVTANWPYRNLDVFPPQRYDRELEVSAVFA
jgi:hypothetical protein